MKELITWILNKIKIPKGILVSLVIALGLIVAKTWFNDYKDYQDELLNELKNQGKIVINVSNEQAYIKSDINDIKNDVQIHGIKIDTLSTLLNSNTRNTFKIMDNMNNIYQQRNDTKEDHNVEKKEQKDEPLSAIESKFDQIITLNNEISSEINIPEPVKKND